MSDLVKISFDKILQTKTYTQVILGTDNKKFAIYTEPQVGTVIQDHFLGAKKPRPNTFELINMFFKGLDVKVKQVVIKDVEDTTYFARIFLEQNFKDEKHIVEIDARPSDCLTLALANNVPLFCTQELLDKTIAIED